jgi:geranylgeranyl pyrophosphate synthase
MPPKMGKRVVANLKKRSKKGREFAKQILQAEKIEHPKLREALEHYIAHWDEFTHLGLFSMACEAVGGDPDDVVSTQAAIAMMTAAFDIYDDIIDKSKVKHDSRTVYGKFGAEMALLLGNAFLIEGFKLFVDSTVILPKEKGKSAFETLKKLVFEVGNAHALEVGLKKRKNVTPKDYMKITEMKAASLEADMYLGALFGGGKDAEVDVLARVGRILGILATLRDDLIDVFDIEELRQRISVQDLPLPLLFAIQDQEKNQR